MTEEEKYINQLFQAARNEAPKRSFDEVATHFEKTVVPTPVTVSSSKLYFKYFSLNTILMTIISSLVIVGFLWVNPSTIEQKSLAVATEKPLKMDQQIKQQEKFVATQPVNNSPLVKKDIEPNLIEAPKKKNNIKVKVDLASKNEQKQENARLEQAQKMLPPSTKAITQTTGIKEKTPTSSSPLSKERTTTNISSPFTEPTIVPIDTAKRVSTKIKASREHAQFLLLRHTANEKIAATFLENIRSYGFSLTEKINRNSEKIERINLHISLYNGLDWKIKLRNFETFELKILLDEYNNPIGLSYRVRATDKFSEVIALNSKARSIHKFSKKGNNSNESHSFTKSFTKSTLHKN